MDQEPGAVAGGINDLGDRPRRRDPEDVIAMLSGHIDVPAAVHRDALGTHQRVPGAVAGDIDDLGDRPRRRDPEGVVAKLSELSLPLLECSLLL